MSDILNDASLNPILTVTENDYLYTFINIPFTDETGDSYPTSSNPDWNHLLN